MMLRRRKKHKRKRYYSGYNNKSKINKDYYGYIFIAPFVIGFVIFFLYPILNTFYLSLTNATIMKKGYEFIGLHNFKVLFNDSYFLKAIGNTWMLWIGTFIPQLSIAMLISVWFTNGRLNLKGVGFFRAIIYLPHLLMPAAVAALFHSLFTLYGPINQLLVQSGLTEAAIEFFRNETFTRGLVIFIQWWLWFGTSALIFTAGLTSIDVGLYESAMIDGANSVKMFFRITIPLLKPIISYMLVTSLVGAMQLFDIPMLLTDGGGEPRGAIMTNTILMMNKFNSSKGHIGAASAVAVVVFIMTCVFAFGIFYFLRDKDKVAEG